MFIIAQTACPTIFKPITVLIVRSCVIRHPTKQGICKGLKVGYWECVLKHAPACLSVRLSLSEPLWQSAAAFSYYFLVCLARPDEISSCIPRCNISLLAQVIAGEQLLDFTPLDAAHGAWRVACRPSWPTFLFIAQSLSLSLFLSLSVSVFHFFLSSLHL